ncbi:hypothetical protein DL96DRAFT_1574846 [Flagelloscypha sp. PMI_526]|nr:hypothetical protein DL96DRAFT_1574846 [Flagelloscypha sp. PMI_526]
MGNTVLHFTFDGEYVLLPGLQIDSWLGFLIACILTVVICFLERLVTTLMEFGWSPSSLQYNRRRLALAKTGLFWLATLLRLLYMIIAMSQNAMLLVLIATSLSIAQFIKELRIPSQPNPSDSQYHELPDAPSETNMLLPSTRPRSRSKPDELFIHPLQSNVARADATAIRMGLESDTENVVQPTYGHDASWQAGAGRDAARQAFASSGLQENGRSHPDSQPFNLGEDSEDDNL